MGDADNGTEHVAKAAGEIIAKDAAGSKGRPGKDFAARGRRTVALVTATVLAIGAAVGIGVGLTRDGGGKAAEPKTSPTSTPTPSATPTLKVSGPYGGTVRVESDPAGHKCCVKPATKWDVLQVRDTSTGMITITLNDVVEGIDLTGPLARTGERFNADGKGTVAGRPNTEVAFAGTVSPEDGLRGTLTVGANGTLPTGQPITFTVDMTKQG